MNNHHASSATAAAGFENLSSRIAQKSTAKKTVLTAALVASLFGIGASNAAHADDLTWNGLTLYGIFDVGLTWQSHGAPLSKDMYVQNTYLVSKNSNKANFSLTGNALSQSRIGLKVVEPIIQDAGFAKSISFVGNAETGFNPTSGYLSDALGSLAKNNGLAQTSARQTTAADGARAGQALNAQLYAGFSSPVLGTITFGRHNGLLTDLINKYDPQGGSYAFSLIGYSGTTAGGGNTQDTRLDYSIKYQVKYDMFRFGALYQPGDTRGSPGEAIQINAGADYAGFSGDFVYAKKDDAISAGSLNAAQVKTVADEGLDPTRTLTGTISDNHSYTLAGSYTNGPWKGFVGYEHITYENPSDPLTGAHMDLGGYVISFVNNTAYTHNKELQVWWGGVKYNVTKKLELTGAYYHLNQDSYNANGCSDRSAGSCAGTEDVFSAVAVYKFMSHLDTYGGIMYSKVSNGLAQGYLYTAVWSPTVGVRFKF